MAKAANSIGYGNIDINKYVHMKSELLMCYDDNNIYEIYFIHTY